MISIEKNKRKIVIGIIVIVLLIFIIGSVLLIFNNSNNSNINNDVKNIVDDNTLEKKENLVNNDDNNVIYDDRDIIEGTELKTIDIPNEEIKKLYSYVKSSLNSNDVCLGEFYVRPFSSLTKDEKISLIFINYAKDYKKQLTNEEIENIHSILGYYTGSEFVNEKVIIEGMKKIYNIEITKNEFKERYWLYTYIPSLNGFISGNGGGGNISQMVNQIINYEEKNDVVEITEVKAEISGKEVFRKASIQDKDTLVYKNVDNFYFTDKNVNLFPQIKYIFKKNSSGYFYLDNIENLNFESDFMECN